jgi:hypothetical protein
LRLLEYQKGLVILTTNRQGDFDTAFQSRIHLKVKYEGLVQEERKSVWTAALNEFNMSHTLGESDLDCLATLTLDGRTITNVVHVLSLYKKGGGKGSTDNMADLKTVLPLVIGKSVEDELADQVAKFCQE